jgi:queuine tRNA-ribosyltransferase
MSRLGFKLEKVASGSRARAATFRTLHNEVKTPLFMPVGTQATVRGQTVETLDKLGSQILLANTYHLLLRPGPEVFQKMGGIHPFMNWKKSVLTDSGGYQIFSLPHSRKMTEEGAEFQSYIDGKRILLTPELSIGTQKAINSDIMMVLDQCIPSTSERALAVQAMNLTHRWAKRSLAARGDSPQSMFAIVQGACFEDLRKQSAEALCEMPFDGFAIGGLAVGETRAQREDFTELSASLLPTHLPRYLMGVGTPIDLLEAVHRGVDMFDCILPVSLAQQGVAYTSRGRMELRRSVYKFSEEKLDPNCPCSTCAVFSRAYLHHLVKAKEVLLWQLIGEHNLSFYHRMMADIRKSILEDRFIEYYRATKPILESSDEENPKTIPKPARVRKRELGEYEVVENKTGSFSIRHKVSTEIMHSVNDPIEEANALYVNQSRLRERLTQDSAEDCVIWDVGLGAATNAMAAVKCFESLKAPAGLKIFSFENDLDSLKLASRFVSFFPHLKHSAPHLLLSEGQWTSPCGKLEWKLLPGDFRARMKDAPKPDFIYYDMYSSKTNSGFWSQDFFRELFAVCGNSELFTYTASTAARAALLSAGFYVSKGCGSGPKQETTIASTRAGNREHLGFDWLEKWKRSQAKFPHDVEPHGQLEFEKRILNHPQFQAPTPSTESPLLAKLHE